VFRLKPIHKEAIASALEKAVRYRVLNEPTQAESICRDVLEIAPENQEAIVTLLLALTDQFPRGLGPRVREAKKLAASLKSEYERAYYTGIVWERQAKCQHEQNVPGRGYAAYHGLRKAMEFYEKAEKLRPSGNDDALLRWNTCVRIIESHADIVPEPTISGEHQLE
jgi:tetratricopeptide (TPR) repeat protein